MHYYAGWLGWALAARLLPPQLKDIDVAHVLRPIPFYVKALARPTANPYTSIPVTQRPTYHSSRFTSLVVDA